MREEDEGYNDVVAAGKRKKFSSLNESRKKGNGGEEGEVSGFEDEDLGKFGG